MWLALLLTGCVLPMEESLARVAFCQSCDLGHVDFLLYCPVIGLKESVSETRIVFKNCCSKVYFLQKPVPYFAYFHRRIIHLVCFSPLCLIWEKQYFCFIWVSLEKWNDYYYYFLSYVCFYCIYHNILIAISGEKLDPYF